LIQQVNREDAAKVFIVCKNVWANSTATTGGYGSPLPQGAMVCHDVATDDTGVSVTRPATANLPFPAGVVRDPQGIGGPDQDLTTGRSNGDYGLIQVYGPCEALVDGTTDVSVGDELLITDGSWAFTKDAAEPDSGSLVGGWAANATAMEAYTTATPALKKVFLRLM
jgi:hypothetical protein